MAWIELHQSLPTHRKTLIASDILDISPVRFVGHIVTFWLWCLDNVPDGNLNGISPRMIARAAQWESDHDQFLEALLTAGFLDQGETLEIHDWFDYAGKLVERREAEKERSKQRRLALRALQDSTQTEHKTTAGRPPDDQQTTVGTVPNLTMGKDIVPFAEVVDDLNQQSGKSYRVCDSTKRLIQARWNNGYRLEHFKTVIGTKAEEWRGTNMDKYLRPETLFNEKKFEAYLNQAPKPKVNTVPDAEEIIRRNEEDGFID